MQIEKNLVMTVTSRNLFILKTQIRNYVSSGEYFLLAISNDRDLD